MCGIAGYIGYDERLNEAVLRRMQKALTHRGPDAEGVMNRSLEQAGGPRLMVGMAHTRLSILDLSDAGRQPMASAGEKQWLCYNGEFFNSPDVRAGMASRGVDFRSTSDTEVLLNLCVEKGVDKAVQLVNGMFAFSFYDESQRSLCLVRDRAGQKPLYYALLNDHSLVYASEIPALLASGLIDSKSLDVQAMDQYWTLGYTTGENTFYKAIRCLRPGTILRWESGRSTFKEYWRLRFVPDDSSPKNIDAYADELVPLLEDAVRVRLLSDVPVGLCLSGGIDSALIALMMSRLREEVPAYTIAFPGQAHDESQHASALARQLKLPHQVLPVSGTDGHLFRRIAEGYGEPFGDASSIPMYFLSELIRQHATVALTGDGGDELFGGYHHYRDGLRLWGRDLLSEEARGPALSWREQIYRIIGPARGFPLKQRHVNGALRRRIYGPSLLGAADHRSTLASRRKWMSGEPDRDALAAMQDCDFHTYMTDDVLRKVDRMSMAHGLECRSPFMDYRVMEFAARLPARVKMSPAGEGKLLLRHILSRFIPEDLYRRPKQGFTPPWEAWCVGAMREAARRDWRALNDPFVQTQAIDLLVPADESGSPVLSWMAYAYLTWSSGRS